MSKETLRVTIRNWEKFNPRNDRTNHVWFRVQNNFFIKTFNLNGEQQRLYLYLCCLGSQENSGTFEFDVELAASLLRTRENKILSDLDKIADAKYLLVDKSRREAVNRPAEAADPRTLSSLQYTTDKQTNNTVHNSADALPCGLDVLWNEHCGEKLPKVKECGKGRKEKIKARLKEHPDSRYWVEVFTKCAKSKFLTGDNGRGWRADFDWLMANDTNATKVLEGRYDGGAESNAFSLIKGEVPA